MPPPKEEKISANRGDEKQAVGGRARAGQGVRLRRSLRSPRGSVSGTVAWQALGLPSSWQKSRRRVLGAGAGGGICRSSPPPVTPSRPLPRHGVGGVGGHPGSARGGSRRVCVCAGQSHGNRLAAPPQPRSARAAASRAPPRRQLRRLTPGPPCPAVLCPSSAGVTARGAASLPCAALPCPALPCRPGKAGGGRLGSASPPAPGLGSRGRRRPGQCRPAAGGERGRWGRGSGRGRLSLLYSPLFPPSRYPRLRPSPLPGSRLAPARPLRSGEGARPWRPSCAPGPASPPPGKHRPPLPSTGGRGSGRRQRPCWPAGRGAFPPSRLSRFSPGRRARSGEQVSALGPLRARPGDGEGTAGSRGRQGGELGCGKVRSGRKRLLRLCPAGGAPRPGYRRCPPGWESGEPVRSGACSLRELVWGGPAARRAAAACSSRPGPAGLEGTLAGREPGPRRVRGAPAAAEVLALTPVCPSAWTQLPKAFERFIQPSQPRVSAPPHGRGRGRKSAANRELKVPKIVRDWWETAVTAPGASCLWWQAPLSQHYC